jgi:hypothetical protein
MKSIDFSRDGKVVASCAFMDNFVLVWGTATGAVLRKLDIVEGEGHFVRGGLAVSSNGDWILRVSAKDRNAFVNLWGPSNQVFSARFTTKFRCIGVCTATIHSSPGQQLRGAILFDEQLGQMCEVHEWILSGSTDPAIIVTTTSPVSEEIATALKQPEQGSRELLLDIPNYRELTVQNSALDGVARCTCKAAAVFDSNIWCISAWSETIAQPGDRASTSPKVAVGLVDGTVHFMELCCNNVSPL